MSIPDLPTIQETSGQTKSGIKYHILGTVQQTLVVELQPNQVVYSDAGAMSWMTTSVNMNTTSGVDWAVCSSGLSREQPFSSSTTPPPASRARPRSPRTSRVKSSRSSWMPVSRLSCTNMPSCVPRKVWRWMSSSPESWEQACSVGGLYPAKTDRTRSRLWRTRWRRRRIFAQTW